MGATLAMQALTFWTPKLLPSTSLVLVRMSLTALDVATARIPAGMYWAGHDVLAAALRGGVTPQNLRTVRRAVSELLEAGAIERVERGFNGHRSVYRLTFS